MNKRKISTSVNVFTFEKFDKLAHRKKNVQPAHELKKTYYGQRVNIFIT